MISTGEDSAAVRRARTEEMGALPPARSTGFGVADSLLVTYGQLVTAAGPAACQHGSAVLGLHALTKSVHFGALAIIRLKSPFRHIGLHLRARRPKRRRLFRWVVCRRI